MSPPIRDTATVRLDNAMLLFEEFVSATVKHPDAAALRGLERRFAERLQIQPSYWSQIKGRSRQIGERLARQFEQLSHKPQGWMDQDHRVLAAAGTGRPASPGATGGAAALPAEPPSLPQDDDERFIVGLVLTYYRRHPQRARTRLLDLLGEVLTPGTDLATPALPGRPPQAPTTPAAQKMADDVDAWRKLQQGIAPLKAKKR